MEGSCTVVNFAALGLVLMWDSRRAKGRVHKEIWTKECWSASIMLVGGMNLKNKKNLPLLNVLSTTFFQIIILHCGVCGATSRD